MLAASTGVHAETAPKEEKKSGIARLVSKLSDKNGNSVAIGILEPLDYTTLGYSKLARETIDTSITRYGAFDIRHIAESPASLTLEEFRRIIIKHKVDVLVIAVLKPTNFDLFLFDKRTRYRVYAHSEVLPEAVQYQVTREIVEEYAKVVTRRALYAYMQEQYFELPREEDRALAQFEIPRWMASKRSLATINRELTSTFYGSANVGAALSFGNSNTWNSNLVGLQVGLRIMKHLYAEAAAEFFSYNALMLGAKYIFMNKETPFRFAAGLSLANVDNAHTLNFDQKFTQNPGIFVVPSAAFIFPIVEVHFKVESRAYVGLSGGTIFTMMPGIFVMF